MAKVHKAHKSTQKYGFQKKKVNVKLWLIIAVAVIAAILCLKFFWYDGYIGGQLEVPAPTAEQLNNIADNWAILNTHTDKFMNYYSLMGYSTDGTDGNGNVALIYMGNDDLDEVSIQVIDVNNNDAETPVTADGAYGRATLTDVINGVAPWGQTAKQFVAQNGNCAISIYDADAAEIDASILAEVIAEIEAIIAEGPVVTETPAEEAAEAAE